MEKPEKTGKSPSKTKGTKHSNRRTARQKLEKRVDRHFYGTTA